MADPRERLRQEIFERIRLLFALERKEAVFIPGKSKVHCAGRVYDQQELISVVEAGLEFWLTAGRFAAEFEQGLACFLRIRHALLVNSGSSANLLAVALLTSASLGRQRLRPGDEVITAAAAFPTTVNPIIQHQLVPVFVDVTLPTYNVRAETIAKAITKKTKAIVLAHTMGNPFEVEAVAALAKKHRLFLVEDACDALGSTYKGKYVGTWGAVGTFSFYPAHHITLGEGGAVVTNTLAFKKGIISLRDWGRACWCEPGVDNTCKRRFQWKLGRLPAGYDHKYTYSHIGYNLKVTDLQAAIGVAQLEKLPEFIRIRQRNFQLLSEGLQPYAEHLILPQATPQAHPSWFGFLITVRPQAPFTKNDLVRYLEQRNIATRMLFAGNIIKQPAYQKIRYRITGSLKNTDLVMRNTFWIGLYPGITEPMIGYVLEQFTAFFKARPWQR